MPKLTGSTPVLLEPARGALVAIFSKIATALGKAASLPAPAVFAQNPLLSTPAGR
jgi:hypothetical protein